jgi:hypothetical protein
LPVSVVPLLLGVVAAGTGGEPAPGIQINPAAQRPPCPTRCTLHQFETQELAYLLVCSEEDEGRRALIHTHTHSHRPNNGSHFPPSRR